MRRKETYETTGPRCPHCGDLHPAEEPWAFDESANHFECENCGESYRVMVYTHTSWTCWVDENDEVEA